MSDPANLLAANQRIRFLESLLIDADDVAHKRGDTYGLCDAIDNHGDPYPSAALDEVLDAARKKLNRPSGNRL